MGCFEFAAQNYIEGTIIYYIDADPHQDMNLATFFLRMCSFLEDFEMLKLRREEY